MPKMKTHKGLRKRIKVSAKGKVRYKQCNAGHLMSSKSGDRCRAMRKPGEVTSKITSKRIRVALGEA